MNFKKPITEFTFQDAEFLTKKIAALIKSFISLLGGFINGIQDCSMFAAAEAEEE